MPLTIQIRGRAAELALQATSRDREAGSMLCSGISRKGAHISVLWQGGARCREYKGIPHHMCCAVT